MPSCRCTSKNMLNPNKHGKHFLPQWPEGAQKLAQRRRQKDNRDETSLNVKVAVVEDVVVVARDDAGHPISTSCWLVPIDIVLLVFIHPFHVVPLFVTKLLIEGALVGERESRKVRLHCRR